MISAPCSSFASEGGSDVCYASIGTFSFERYFLRTWIVIYVVLGYINVVFVAFQRVQQIEKTVYTSEDQYQHGINKNINNIALAYNIHYSCQHNQRSFEYVENNQINIIGPKKSFRQKVAYSGCENIL